jgi:hypothetical protein
MENQQMKECLSSRLPVKYGVPQGSVLGPLLFILYINDIPRLRQGKTFMYADDTTLMNVGLDIKEVQQITAANAGVVEQYFEINNLLLNPYKNTPHLIPENLSIHESNLKIPIKNSEIANIKSTNFLGAVINNTLSWEDHVEMTCSRMSRNLFLMNRLLKLFDLNRRRMLYYGFSIPFCHTESSYGDKVLRHSLEEFLFLKRGQ